MPVSLSGRHFLRLLDFSTEEIEYLLKLSKNFKDMKRAGVPHRYLEGKNIVLLFQKTSTRTRCAFEVGGEVNEVLDLLGGEVQELEEVPAGKVGCHG